MKEVYYLNQDFLFLNINNANAITVNASGVTIDFNGHTISDVAAGKGVSASGVFSANGARLTVRNGTIRGFTYGVYLVNLADYGVLIEHMRFLENTYAGISLWAGGSIVRHCQMFRIGGSTQPQWPNGVGVLVFGSNDSVQDCDISELINTNPTYDTHGIYANLAYGTLITDNRISGVHNGMFIATSASCKYCDNLCAVSVAVPYTGGTNAGNN